MPIINQQAALPACVSLTLTEAKALSMYKITVLDSDDAPVEFTLDGSNNGTAWTTLDYRVNEAWASYQTREFPIVSETAYKYYRLRAVDTASGALLILAVDIYVRVTSIVGHGVGESEISQGHAQQLATTAAEADAAANLAAHCRQIFTATATKTKTCPNFLGSVTGVGSGSSFISAADAQTQADDEAEAKATALLAQCATGNNTLLITIPDSGIASPYPSVQSVEADDEVVITSVTVEINGLSHGSIEDVQIILKSPAGTVVELMRNCGGTTSVGGGGQSGPVSPGINLVFDQTAGSLLPDNSAFVAGTYRPSQYGSAANMATPAPQSPYLTSLDAFNGEDPNGPWTLWVQDRLALFSGAIYGGWSVTIS